MAATKGLGRPGQTPRLFGPTAQPKQQKNRYRAMHLMVPEVLLKLHRQEIERAMIAAAHQRRGAERAAQQPDQTRRKPNWVG
jgi:hypothetical protein